MKLKTKKLLTVFFIIYAISISMPAFADEVTLDIQIRRNPPNFEWCWAASCSSILYHYGVYVSQLCDLATWLFNSACCAYPQTCNRGANNSQMDAVLDNWGVSAWDISNSLTWNEVQQEINAGKPFGIGVEEIYGDDAHAVVGFGYDTWGVGYVHYMDPNWGYLSKKYSDMLNDGNLRWFDTLKMIDYPPAICAADLQGDLQVGLADLAIMKTEFGRTDCETNCCKADIGSSRDQCSLQNDSVGLGDLGCMKTQFGWHHCGGKTPPCTF